jgi:adenosylcobyric acid synthase
VNARAVMVLGTTSGAGKSLLATALCRWYARQGLKVAPFKAQNMSNNARVVPGLAGGVGEIGSAQYFQAMAARTTSSVRMNPVLIKPEHCGMSQVVVLGDVRPDLARMPWTERSEQVWPCVREALHDLLAEHDVVVIEGAGSPAEINLHASDFVNMRTALEADAACLLVTDIDRGGAFAHLYGTHQLLAPHERALLRGFVLNRFRGDAELLAPGWAQLRALTGVPTLAVLPMWRGHGLPEEDAVFDDTPTGATEALRIAVVAYPSISNLDEFQPLRNVEGVRLTWARRPVELDDVDWIILPGSKDTLGDLGWVREQKIDAAIDKHADGGRQILGVCGGLQMLGESLTDADRTVRGLGLLPLTTVFDRQKSLRNTQAQFATTTGAWSAVAELGVDGYEIRHGCTSQRDSTVSAAVALRNHAGEAIGWQRGSVLGVYAHGLFERDTVLRALFGAGARTQDSVFEGLADFIDAHFEAGALLSLIRK